MYDAAVIGAGPAGVSASLYCLRAGLKTAVFDCGVSSLLKAEKIDNYYGAPGISGRELYQNGIDGIISLGAVIVNAEITGIDWQDGFTVKSTGGAYQAKTLLIAAGTPPKRPRIDGLERFEGAGVSYCAVCDGFFYRNKKVGVLGAGEYAASEADELSRFAKSVVVFTNGKDPGTDFSFTADRRKIKSITGADRIEGILFENGETEPLDGLFVAEGRARSADFALKLGVEISDGIIKTNDKQQTNVPGLYAAGDCASHIKQISVAVGQGAAAGIAMIEYCRRS